MRATLAAATPARNRGGRLGEPAWTHIACAAGRRMVETGFAGLESLS